MRGFRIIHHTEKVGGGEVTQRKEPWDRVRPRPEGHSPGSAKQRNFGRGSAEAPRPATPWGVEPRTVVPRDAARPCGKHIRRPSRGVATSWQQRHR